MSVAPGRRAAVIGVGLDAVDVDRFRSVLERRRGFCERVFSEGERSDVGGRRDPVPGLAARFAAKEAAMKALSVGLGSVDFADIEVVRLPGGAPSLRVSGRAFALGRRLGVSGYHVSLTHTAALAEAIVIAL